MREHGDAVYSQFLTVYALDMDVSFRAEPRLWFLTAAFLFDDNKWSAAYV